MTNIVALSGCENRSGNPYNFLVFCADGMGSYTGMGRKHDYMRKLFKIGDSFLMGTGSMGDLYAVTDYMKANQVTGTPDDLAHLAINICAQNGIKGRVFNIILGGKNKDGSLGIRHVNASRYIKGKRTLDMNPIRDDTKSGSMDGSGYQFVGPLLDVSNTLGVPIDTDTLANTVVSAYEMGMRGAVSSTVNSEMQYGIITPDIAVTIMSPKIEIHGKDHSVYINDLLGITIPDLSAIKDEKDKIEEYKKYTGVGMIVEQIYNTLDFQLRDYSSTRRGMTWTHHEWSQRRCGTESIEYMDKLLQEKKSELQETVEALVSADPKRLVECRRKHNSKVESYEQKHLGI